MTHLNGSRLDPEVINLYRTLDAYVEGHPLAEIGVFRRDPDRLSVRIIDPSFHGKSLRQRHDAIWTLLRDAGASADKVSVLLLMTPDEAVSAHLEGAAEHDSQPGAAGRPRSNRQVSREEVLGRDVFVTVSPAGSVGNGPSDRFYAWVKFDYPPGIIDADDYGVGGESGELLRYGLSVDDGELVCDEDRQPRAFDSLEAARAAAVATAKERLARLSAA